MISISESRTSGAVPLVYLAGPDVFMENWREISDNAKLIASHLGLRAIFPLDNEYEESEDLAASIFEANRAMIDRSDYVAANLNDFRGLEPDSGTVWEVAYAFAKGKPVVGYRSCDNSMLTRLQEAGRCDHAVSADGVFRDKDGLMVENFGAPLNLMVQKCLSGFVLGAVGTALSRISLIHYGKELNLSTIPGRDKLKSSPSFSI